MERKLFLDLCQQEAMTPNSATVKFNGIVYHPIAYQLSYKDDGSVRHTAVLKHTETNYCCYVDLSVVKEV